MNGRFGRTFKRTRVGTLASIVVVNLVSDPAVSLKCSLICLLSGTVLCLAAASPQEGPTGRWILDSGQISDQTARDPSGERDGGISGAFALSADLPAPPPPPDRPVIAGPYIRFGETAGSVTIEWETRDPGPSIVEYGKTGDLSGREEDPAPKTAHALRLAGLEPGAEYFFRIRGTEADGTELSAAVHRFDALFDWGPEGVEDPPYPFDGKEGRAGKEDASTMASAAEAIIARTGIARGYALVFGCGEGRLAYELARRTDLRIIAVEEDPEKVQAAREALHRAGLYGEKVSIHQGSLKDLPYPDYFANLIVSESLITSGRMTGNPRELYRVLRPCGGVACLGPLSGEGKERSRAALQRWLLKGSVRDYEIHEDRAGIFVETRRGPLAGSGEWTHAYADPGNTACSGDALVQDPMEVLWFGRPGPRLMIDRHHRAMPPLCKDGRIFVTANDRFIAVDAYNGTRLWDVAVPGARRVGIPRDCGYVAAGGDRVYAAVRNGCLVLDAATGRPRGTIEAPQHIPGEVRHWGYLAFTENRLFGTGQKPRAPRTGHSKDTIYDGTYFDSRPIVTGDYLFCLDPESGDERWHYRGGVIINPAIAIGDGHVFFLESRSPEAAEDPEGRVPLQTLLAPGRGYLVKVNAGKGNKVWERQVDLPLEHAVFLSLAGDLLLVTGTRNEGSHPHYLLHAFSATTGKERWNNSYQGPGPVDGDHGEQDQHPVILAHTVYSRPFAFSLRTGAQEPLHLDRAGHGCGTLSGSAAYLFGRGWNPQMYDLSRGGINIPLSLVNRPGCWINIIPAGGLVLIPESSSGCTCAFPIQTSIAFKPKSRNEK